MSYQRIYRPRLFVSWPLYQFTVGQMLGHNWAINPNILDVSAGDDESYNMNEDCMYKLSQLDPARYSLFKLNLGVTNQLQEFRFGISGTPYAGDLSTDEKNSIMSSFDYLMILGHNMASCHAAFDIQEQYGGSMMDSGLVNAPLSGAEAYPQYNGFSLCEISGGGNGSDYLSVNVGAGGAEILSEVFAMGSIMFGKSYTFPYNADIEQITTFNYGIKTRGSVSGRSIAINNWSHRNKWATNPFDLSLDNIGDNAIDAYQMSGRRSWKCKFSFLAPEHVVGQNLNTNSNGWSNVWKNADGVDTTYSGYIMGGNDDSVYNLLNPAETDFYSIVVNRTLGGALPMVLQLDAVEGGNPDSFAIVRMNPNYEIRHVGRDIYEIELDLVEQI